MTQPTSRDTPAPNASDARPATRDGAAAPTPGAPPADAPAPDGPAPERAVAERPIPIGCHPFVFGVVAATIQLALTIFLMRSC